MATCITQTITAPASTKVLNAPRAPVPPSIDQFSVHRRAARAVIATEFSYRKDEEIYGEGEPAEYVYQVIRGAVRTYKLLNDGRRQIGAFHLPGDVFGLDSGSDPSPDGRSHRRYHRPPGETPQPGSSRGIECQGRP